MKTDDLEMEGDVIDDVRKARDLHAAIVASIISSSSVLLL